MAKKQKKAAEGADAAAAEKKPATVKLATVVMCLGLAGGGYMLGGRSAAPAAGAESGAPATTLPPREDGCVVDESEKKDKAEEGAHELPHVVDLPAMSVNLSDGHYLRIAVSLGLCPGVKVAAADDGGHGKAEKGAITFVNAPAQDILVETLSGEHMDHLATQEGREAVRHELTEQIRHAYPAVVSELFFIEFVMQ